jgi:hypothetical protein
MREVVFLYKGDEPGSIALCAALGQLLPTLDVKLWFDSQANDPGFAAQLREALGRCDAIVHCIGPKGIGFYQSLNEIDRTVDAMNARAERRLVVLLLDGA